MGVRKVRLEDLKEIDRIYIDGSIDEGRLQFPDVSRNKMIRQLKEDAKSRMGGFKKDLKNKKHFWIAVGVGDKIAGFGQAWLKNKDTGVIEKVYVGMRHRKKGTGKKIILLLVKWLKKKKIKYIESSIYWRNKPSIKLHEKIGFKPISLKMRLKR